MSKPLHRNATAARADEAPPFRHWLATHPRAEELPALLRAPEGALTR